MIQNKPFSLSEKKKEKEELEEEEEERRRRRKKRRKKCGHLIPYVPLNSQMNPFPHELSQGRCKSNLGKKGIPKKSHSE